MSQVSDLSRSFTPFDQEHTLVVVIEMSESTWLAAAMVPGVARAPLKKLDPDADQLLKRIARWREEALPAGHFHWSRRAGLWGGRLGARLYGRSRLHSVASPQKNDVPSSR